MQRDAISFLLRDDKTLAYLKQWDAILTKICRGPTPWNFLEIEAINPWRLAASKSVCLVREVSFQFHFVPRRFRQNKAKTKMADCCAAQLTNKDISTWKIS